MADVTRSCPKCGEAMEQGFLLDSAYGGPGPSRWIEGLADRIYLSSLRDRTQYMITAWRCVGCGFVELYASDTPREM